jgi:hypothetical protein
MHDPKMRAIGLALAASSRLSLSRSPTPHCSGTGIRLALPVLAGALEVVHFSTDT